MATAVSGISLAVQGVADHLAAALGSDVVVSVDNPLAANEQAKGNSKNVVNVFVYRISPSGFHAATRFDEPLFIRLHALITPFVHGAVDNEERDRDLRLLGHVIRALHSHPVLPLMSHGPLPGAPAAGDVNDFRLNPHTRYRLEIVMQSPSMEELNHIWTTQGGELAYRLSAAYEFSLVPEEAEESYDEAGPVRTAMLDVHPSMKWRDEPFQPYSEETRVIPLSAVSEKKPPPVPWLPLQLFVHDGVLSNTRFVPSSTASVDVAISGLVGGQAGISVVWTRRNGTGEMQSPQFHDITTALIDEAVPVPINLDNAQAGDKAVLRARPARGNVLVPDSPDGNRLLLSVEGV